MEIVHMFEDVLCAHSQNAFEQVLLDPDCTGWSTLRTCIIRSSMTPEFVTLFEKWISSAVKLDLDAQDSLGKQYHAGCKSTHDVLIS
jgi:hypothetical protein